MDGVNRWGGRSEGSSVWDTGRRKTKARDFMSETGGRGSGKYGKCLAPDIGCKSKTYYYELSCLLLRLLLICEILELDPERDLPLFRFIIPCFYHLLGGEGQSILSFLGSIYKLLVISMGQSIAGSSQSLGPSVKDYLTNQPTKSLSVIKAIRIFLPQYRRRLLLIKPVFTLVPHFHEDLDSIPSSSSFNLFLLLNGAS